MGSTLTLILTVQKELDRVEFARIEAQAFRLAQPAVELTIHIRLGAYDGVALVVADHHRRLCAG